MSCHPERSEGSVNTKGCIQILRDAQNDTLIGDFYFDTLSLFYNFSNNWSTTVSPNALAFS